MATNDEICKVDVLNPLSMFNTVGKELEDIFISRGMTDASQRMGIKDLSKKEKLTDKQIEKARELLDMDGEFCTYLHKFQEDYQQEKEKCKVSYREARKNFTRLKNILPLLRNEFNDGIDKLEDILDFFDVNSEEEIFQSSETIATLFRQQNNVAVDPVNLKAWLRRAELDYQQMVLPPYNENAFKQWIDSREWENHIEDVDFFMGLPDKLAKFGVALIFVPFLKKTVYGAVRWKDNRPLIEISDRNQDLATCWFTLFHEFGHVIKHKNEEILEGELNEPKSKKARKETEANKFANYYLFHGDNLRKEVFACKQAGKVPKANYLSQKYGVNILLAAYWLLRAQLDSSFQKRKHIDFTSRYQ